jgi:hypothetical protein
VVGVLAHRTVDDVRVGPDQDTEPIGPDTIQNDFRCLGRAGRRVGDEAPGALGVHAFDVNVGIFLRVAADRREPGEDMAVDPLAQMDSENLKLRAELDTARQSFKSERAAKEELQDALHRLRSDITRVLSASEKAMWDTMPPPPPEKRAEKPEPEPSGTGEEAVSLIYRRSQTETCETVAEALNSVPMQDWERDDFDRLAEALNGCAQWYGDHNDMRIPLPCSRRRRSCLAPQTACSSTRMA